MQEVMQEVMPRKAMYILFLPTTEGYITRAPVAVSANFAIVGGGGICYHPLLTQKPIGLERCGKKHWIALDRYV